MAVTDLDAGSAAVTDFVEQVLDPARLQVSVPICMGMQGDNARSIEEGPGMKIQMRKTRLRPKTHASHAYCTSHCFILWHVFLEHN